ncbi:MAG: HAD-IA family hydrolase [Candidatus Coatesbacteria bacterium]|nr:MAG: HAD-IA family hydrolase [Candidatus Coatesbacteria bacterium]
MLKAAIFDLDNTLTDFTRMKERAVEAAAEAMVDAGLPRTRDEAVVGINEIYGEYGIEYQHVFDEYLKSVLGRVDERILAAGIVGYRQGREGTLSLYPHVNLTLLELAKRGLKLAVLSDAPARQAWLRLAYLKLHNLFDAVVTHDDTGQLKPAREPFDLVLGRLDVEPYEALMVGDWPERDIAGAKTLGITTIYARYGGLSGRGGGAADYVIDDILEVVKIADYINSQGTLIENRELLRNEEANQK